MTYLVNLVDLRGLQKPAATTPPPPARETR
jgi:hypothetical protein